MLENRFKCGNIENHILIYEHTLRGKQKQKHKPKQKSKQPTETETEMNKYK